MFGELPGIDGVYHDDPAWLFLRVGHRAGDRQSFQTGEARKIIDVGLLLLLDCLASNTGCRFARDQKYPVVAERLCVFGLEPER